MLSHGGSVILNLFANDRSQNKDICKSLSSLANISLILNFMLSKEIVLFHNGYSSITFVYFNATIPTRYTIKDSFLQISAISIALILFYS